MKAGKTEIECGTKIRTTLKWQNAIVTGEITHPFGAFGMYDHGAIAGIRIDKEFQSLFGEIGNLMEGDFEVIPE